MMSRFSSFVLALLLLVASGQVMAVGTCTSGGAGDLDGTEDGVPWAAETVDGTGCSMTTGTIAAPDSTNVLVIGHAITAPTATTAISVSGISFTAGSLTLTAKTLNVGTTLNAAGGTVTIGTSGTLNVTGNVTVGTDGTIDMTGGILSIGVALNNTAGTLTTGTGTLKLTNADHAITVAAGKIFAVVDASLLTGATGSGKLITFAGAFDNTISSLTLPAAAGIEIKFVVPEVKKLTISATTGGTVLNCTATVTGTGSVAPTVTGTTAAPILTASTTTGTTSTFTCATATATTTISAPIFSTKEKAAVFTEEVKH